MELRKWNPNKPKEIMFYWMYQAMKKHNNAPKFFDFGVQASGQYYHLKPTKFNSDLRSFIIVNLGKNNLVLKRCQFCGEDGAFSFTGSQWAFHLKCLRSMDSLIDEHCTSMKQLIKVMEQELVLDDKQKLITLEFLQIRCLVGLYDLVTGKKHELRRVNYGLNTLVDWHFEDDPNHTKYQ